MVRGHRGDHGRERGILREDNTDGVPLHAAAPPEDGHAGRGAGLLPTASQTDKSRITINQARTTQDERQDKTRPHTGTPPQQARKAEERDTHPRRRAAGAVPGLPALAQPRGAGKETLYGHLDWPLQGHETAMPADVPLLPVGKRWGTTFRLHL